MSVIRKLSKINASYYICIPPEIRKHLSVERGDYLVWYVGRSNEVILDKLSSNKYQGLYPVGGSKIKNNEEI